MDMSKINKTINLDIQMFAESDPTLISTILPANLVKEKTYSKEYVIHLRKEAKRHRLKAKAYEAQLRIVNDCLVMAEIKSMDGYDPALVMSLLDRSKVTIDPNGVISGLQKAIEDLTNEIPAIKKISVPNIREDRCAGHYSTFPEITIITAGAAPFTVSYRSGKCLECHPL